MSTENNNRTKIVPWGTPEAGSKCVLQTENVNHEFSLARSLSLSHKDQIFVLFNFYITHMFEVSERDELDNVTEDRFSFGRSQDPVVSVQHLHITEICVPNPNNYDGHGEVGGLDDGLSRVSHVGDNTVR